MPGLRAWLLHLIEQCLFSACYSFQRIRVRLCQHLLLAFQQRNECNYRRVRRVALGRRRGLLQLRHYLLEA
jgi:hypothetical protein